MNKLVSATAKMWLNECRKPRSAGKIKLAVEGGDTVPFETAFSNLAHAYLRDRAPQLLDYALGFQLLEKNEDNTRAVGVLGFLLDDQLLLNPYFFLSGELKGYELLFLKNQNIFVPMKDTWVDYLLSKRNVELGKSVDKNLRQQGVDYPYLGAFSDTPGKRVIASDLEMEEGLGGLAQALGTSPEYPLLVPELVKESSEIANRFLQLIDSRPLLFKPITECYGKNIVKEALVTAQNGTSVCDTAVKIRIKSSSIMEDTVYDPNKDLAIHIYNGNPVKSLSKEASEKLIRDGMYIEDNRKTASVAYKIQKPTRFQGITENGLYSVIIKPTDITDVVVFTDTVTAIKYAFILYLDKFENKYPFTTINTDDILFIESKEKEYKKFLDDLPTVKDIIFKKWSWSEDDSRVTYILVNPEGCNSTPPFRVISGKDGNYKIEFAYRAPVESGIDCGSHYPPEPTFLQIRDSKDGSLIQIRDTVYVPSDTKVIKAINLADIPEEERKFNGHFGSVSDALTYMYKEGTVLKVFDDNYEVSVNDRRMTHKAALLHLMRDHGFRKEAAENIIKSARVYGAEYIVKYAQPYPYPMVDSGIQAPAIPDGPYGADDYFNSGLPLSSPMHMDMPITDTARLQSYADNTRDMLAAPPSQTLMAGVARAANTGKKEILDASILKSLLKGRQSETIVDKYQGKLLSALDAMGRLYFNFLWHNEFFENRYGADKMPDLEDALRTNFDSLGDLVIELKKMAVEPYAGESVDSNLQVINEM